MFHRPAITQRRDGDMRIVWHVGHPNHLWDRALIGVRDGACWQQKDDCPLAAPVHRRARPGKRGPPVHNPQGRWVYAAPGMWREQGDRRRIVLLSVTFKDIPQQEQEGGQRDERHGLPRVRWVLSFLPVPAHHIHVPRSGLPSAFAGLLSAHRVN